MTQYRLTIDLRTRIDARTGRVAYLMDVSLFSPGNVLDWAAVEPLHAAALQLLMEQTLESFNPNLKDRDNSFKILGELAARSFSPNGDFPELCPEDSLLIETSVTSIPWDLVDPGKGFLGHALPTGLRIPTRRRGRAGLPAMAKRRRFLHIVSNPLRDLDGLTAEQDRLERLVEETSSDIEYVLLIDPTPFQIMRYLTTESDYLVHYSGHIAPDGFVLSDGHGKTEIFSLDDIQRFLPAGDRIVFLNGCGHLYDRQTGETEKVEEPNLFPLASVANCFLDAGAGAVIAQRTKVGDRDSVEAAEEIWRLILANETIGSAVRTFRSAKAERDPNSIAPYSYVLYGSPTARLGASAANRVFVPSVAAGADRDEIQDCPLLRRIWCDPGTKLGPQHLFGALTTTWLIGRIYLNAQGQLYFESLELLRAQFGLGRPESGERAGELAFSLSGRTVVDRALAISRGTLDEMALLQALAEVDDPDVDLGLKSLQIGPRNVREVLAHARHLRTSTAATPRVVIAPDGYADPDVFLPKLARATDVRIDAGALECWDLFVGLLAVPSLTSAFCRERGLAPPAEVPWRAGASLHWSDLARSARQTLLEAVQMFGEEGESSVSEAMMIHACISLGNLDWDALPERARSWLTPHFRETSWMQFLQLAHLESLGWL